MQSILVLMTIFMVVGEVMVVNCQTNETDEQFLQFIRSNRRRYQSPTEFGKRYDIWKKNFDFIQKHNREADQGLHSYWLEMNGYGDLNVTEFSSLVNGHKESLRLRNPVQYDQIVRPPKDPAVLPKSFDWRTRGVVTSVKNQGTCGSCWAFAAVGVLEAQLMQQTGRLVDLSEQELVDCSRNYDNEGCDGGFPELALAYARDKRGLSTEASYPYKDKDQTCPLRKTLRGFSVTGIRNIATGDEQALKSAIAMSGPVAVAIDASIQSFQFYKKGLFYDAACRSDMNALDHAVLVVGYGTTSAGQDYWIVKNSWGTTWGQSGYIFMARNRGNHCGIATDAVYATLRPS